jgi:SOS response regulatory protein OraA/RecX
MKNDSALNFDDTLYSKILGSALNFVSGYSRTTYEVDRKLTKLLSRYEGTDLDISALKIAVIEELIEMKLLDDKLYAQMYVQQQFGKNSPKSPREVTSFLRKKGLDIGTIEGALGQYTSEEELAAISAVASKKSYSGNKLISYLTAKGYDYYLVKQYVDDLQ